MLLSVMLSECRPRLVSVRRGGTVRAGLCLFFAC